MANDDLISSSNRKLSDAQRLDWLRLIRTENIGPVTFRELINHFGGAAVALDALPDLSRRGGKKKPLKAFPKEAAQKELETAKKIGAQLIAMGEPGYPPWLITLDAPPPLLYVKGVLNIVERPIVSIVGARNGSAAGQKFTRQIASELGRENFTIASGLARGIDTASHIASLATGTVAVLAGGIDVVYPKENADLYGKIAEQGLIVSERPPGLQPRAKDFPRRNRIVSGMAVGVVVVEAARRSGSLITARFAMEQNREIFAVPGHPLDPRADGTNALIKDGAALITCTADIIKTLTPILGRKPLPSKTGLEDRDSYEAPQNVERTQRESVISALGPAPIEIDELIRSTGLSASQVQIVLLELDLAGRLERHGRQLVSLRMS